MRMVSSWVAHTYALTSFFFLPVALFFIIPLKVLSTIYLVTTICFGFVSIWFAVETLAALYIYSKETCQKSSDPKKITYILPAYMDNEATVLEGTIRSYLDMEYNGHIHIMVVYNSKNDMRKAEEKIHKKWDNYVCGNTCVTIVKNTNSTSKAENVNYGLSLIDEDVDYIAIMDADHQPAKNNPSVAMKVMEDKGFDILQGVCTIRNQENFLSTIISVEFADMYSVGHQGRLQLFNFGIFGGSNGYWKAEILKEIKMDGSMLTEDIDSSIRATLAGYKIGFSGEVISSELSPIREATLQKQRLRWAQGWAQVSLKYANKCICSDLLSIRQKLGLIYLLTWREIFPYMTFWPLICVAAHIKSGNNLDFRLFITLFGAILFIFGICRVWVIYKVSKGPIKSKGRAFILFALFFPFYSIYMNYLQICAHGRSILSINAWNPTPREESKNGSKFSRTTKVGPPVSKNSLQLSKMEQNLLR